MVNVLLSRSGVLFGLLLAILTAVEPASALENAANTVSASDQVTLRDLGGLSVSPDGASAAFQVRQADTVSNRYQQSWYIAPTDGGPVRRLADAGDPLLVRDPGGVNGSILPIPPVWSPDSMWIAYLRKDGDRTQIWRSRIDGRGAQQLTRNVGDPDQLAYSQDGHLLFFTTRLSQPQIDQALAEESLTGFRFDERFTPGRSPLPVRLSAQQMAARDLWIYDFATQSERRATQEETSDFQGLQGRFGGRSIRLERSPEPKNHTRGKIAVSSGGGRAWLEARDPERQGAFPPLTVVAQPVGQRVPIVCEAPECTAQRADGLWWRSEEEVVFLRRDRPGFPGRTLYAWRPSEGGGPRNIMRTNALYGDTFEWDCAIGRDRLICFYETPAYPRRLVAINLDDGVIEVLFDPNPGWGRYDLGREPQLLAFRSPSGVETFGYLVRPPRAAANERLPLIIVTYRCAGFLRGGTGDEYPIYPFAAQGFAVLCFDAPTADLARYERASFSEHEQWARGPGDPQKRRVQEALDAAVAQLDDMGIIDPTRVGLTGLSFGADTVKYALFNMPSLTTAIASGTPIEPPDAFLSMRAGREWMRQVGLGSPTSERWESLSLARNVHLVRAPLLLHLADHEMLSSMEIFAAFEVAGRAIEMYIFPEEYHIKWQPAHRLAIYERNIDWMNFWLREVEESNPEKANQYRHWQEMRERQCAVLAGASAPSFCKTSRRQN